MLRFLWLGVAFFFVLQSAVATETMVEEHQEEMPNAMKHMMQAPEIDFVNLRDPFASYLELVSRRNYNALREQNARLDDRPREILEDYDLSTLKIVGIYSMGGDRVAMIQDSQGKGYVVRRGNYMGKSNGRIEKIEASTLYLVEQAINPAGDIVDHQVSLTLEEVNE